MTINIDELTQVEIRDLIIDSVNRLTEESTISLIIALLRKLPTFERYIIIINSFNLSKQDKLDLYVELQKAMVEGGKLE